MITNNLLLSCQYQNWQSYCLVLLLFIWCAHVLCVFVLCFTAAQSTALWGETKWLIFLLIDCLNQQIISKQRVKLKMVVFGNLTHLLVVLLPGLGVVWLAPRRLCRLGLVPWSLGTSSWVSGVLGWHSPWRLLVVLSVVGRPGCIGVIGCCLA